MRQTQRKVQLDPQRLGYVLYWNYNSCAAFSVRSAEESLHLPDYYLRLVTNYTSRSTIINVLISQKTRGTFGVSLCLLTQSQLYIIRTLKEIEILVLQGDAIRPLTIARVFLQYQDARWFPHFLPSVCGRRAACGYLHHRYLYQMSTGNLKINGGERLQPCPALWNVIRDFLLFSFLSMMRSLVPNAHLISSSLPIT